MRAPRRLTSVVDAVMAAIDQGDWDGLKPMLHPYLHWSTASGIELRGRTKVLAYLMSGPNAPSLTLPRTRGREPLDVPSLTLPRKRGREPLDAPSLTRPRTRGRERGTIPRPVSHELRDGQIYRWVEPRGRGPR